MGNLYEHLFATESTFKEVFFLTHLLQLSKSVKINKVLAPVLSLQLLDILDV